MKAAALVLAAGQASRFGADKLAARLEGKPLLAHAIEAALAAPVDRVVVVTRPGSVADALAVDSGVDVLPVDSGSLSQSLQAGIAAIAGHTHAFIFLGDMPRIPHPIATLLADRIGDAYAAMPRVAGRAGHPVLLSAASFPDIGGLRGDAGAGRLLRARGDVVMVDVDDAGIHFDVDVPADLGRA